MTAPATQSILDRLRTEDEAGECWSARDLMAPLGYDRWERFADAIERAISAINNAGRQAPDHIRGAAKLVHIGSGVDRHVIDYRLTRFGAYMLAMNGDPRKPEIAAAQSYFAIRTREAELSAGMPDVLDPAGNPAHLKLILQASHAALISLEAAEARAAELAPRAASWDHLASSQGDLSVNEAATTLSRAPGIVIGGTRLWKLLDAWGWTYRQHGVRHAYQTQVSNGRLATRAQSHHHPRTGELILDPPQIRVTAKGLAEIHRRLSQTTLALVGAS